jgi:hypothetical protein
MHHQVVREQTVVRGAGPRRRLGRRRQIEIGRRGNQMIEQQGHPWRRPDLMVGTLQLSRALADRQLAEIVLEQGIRSARTLLGAEARGDS